MLISNQENKELLGLCTVIISSNEENKDIDSLIFRDSENYISEK